MPFFTDPPLHDFPDRAHRLLLEHPDNLRDLISAVAPELVGGFAFDRMRRLDRALNLPDWRRRESDLLFSIPYQGPVPSPDAEPSQSVLVCLLVEHQSQEDQSMPLRTLLYAVLYWDREWKAWEERRQRGEPLRLSPVLPIVFHTGREPWATHRTFADLFVIPEPFRPHVVSWRPLFWDLASAVQRCLATSGRRMAPRNGLGPSRTRKRGDLSKHSGGRASSPGATAPARSSSLARSAVVFAILECAPPGERRA